MPVQAMTPKPLPYDYRIVPYDSYSWGCFWDDFSSACSFAGTSGCEWDDTYELYIGALDLLSEVIAIVDSEHTPDPLPRQNEYVQDSHGILQYRLCWRGQPAIVQICWRTQSFPQRWADPLSVFGPEDVTLAVYEPAR